MKPIQTLKTITHVFKIF